MEDGAFLNISYATVVGSQDTEIMDNGIEPDIEVESIAGEEKTKDRILETAIDRAKKKSEEAA
jgi:C-terminal processing protease CtpA/Prc